MAPQKVPSYSPITLPNTPPLPPLPRSSGLLPDAIRAQLQTEGQPKTLEATKMLWEKLAYTTAVDCLNEDCTI